MTETPKSNGEVHIERIMQELDPSSDRYQVLNVAKRFKASWVELGEQLTQVDRQGLYQQWGYTSFDDYCAKEVRIKKPTAQKLTMAYHFMEKEEPELLARKTELKPLPDYQAVDLLRQAREEKDFTHEEYAELRKAVVDEERSLPAIRKQFKEVADAKSDEPEDPLIHLKASLNASRRIETALRSVEDVPPEFLEQAANLTAYLEERVEALKDEVEGK